MARLTRREAIGLGLASAAAFGFRAPRTAARSPAPLDGLSGQAGGSVTFPAGAVIRTLLRDVPPASLAGGPVLFHEHLSMRFPFGATAHFTDDVELMIEEVRAAAHDNVRCIVDAGHLDMGRNLDALKRIAAESGMPIVASGGYYMQRWYPPELATKSVGEIADELVRDARDHRFGALGEIGQSAQLTDGERRVFQAVGRAHLRTGLPILTHNAYTGMRTVNPPVPRDAALRQLDILETEGVKPQHIAIGHVCCLDDPAAEIAIQVAKRGAFVGFDRATIQAIIPDAKRVTMALALIEAGYADQLLLSSDFAAASSLRKNGGPGIAQAATVFGPMLAQAGLSQAALARILVDNPRRFLAFVPV